MNPAAPLRLAIVVSHPTQYYSPWFRWLAAHTPLEFRVFYLWEFGVAAQRDRQFGATFKWDVDLLSGYAHEFVPNVAPDPGTHHFGGLRNPQLTARLAAWAPGAVLLFGYKWSAHLRAIAWGWRRGIPLLFRGDSHFLGRGAPAWTTRVVLRILYSRFAAALYVGAANRDYFTTLGVQGSRLFFAPHAVDSSHYDPRQDATRAAAAELRSQLGLAPSTRVVLFAGKFVPAKQPRELLRAFLALRAPDAALVMVGDGEEKTALHDLARAAPPGTVHFLPFANQSEMPARYLLADVFALPSRGFYETWGLAVNEAMHMGVPALVSDRVGCQRDLVTDGATGWVFPADDPGALQAKLGEALAAVRADREGFRARVMARVADYSYAAAARGLMQALEGIAARR
jgi:glycosyltransferase involved in cell wall biosynthesis